MTVAPIPFTAIDAFAEANGVEDRERFARHIRRMDHAALRFYRKKNEREDEEDKNGDEE